jgi:hypothetical protein
LIAGLASVAQGAAEEPQSGGEIAPHGSYLPAGERPREPKHRHFAHVPQEVLRHIDRRFGLHEVVLLLCNSYQAQYGTCSLIVVANVHICLDASPIELCRDIELTKIERLVSKIVVGSRSYLAVWNLLTELTQLREHRTGFLPLPRA